MNQVRISRKDIIWGYVAQFFSMASGIIVLPLILSMLSSEEIGLNYLMLTIGTLVSLFDFGFVPQFARNITYVFSGAQKLVKEGSNDNVSEVNYKLLATMIAVARMVYKRLAICVLFIMLTLGTVYIYRITLEFTLIKNLLYVGLIYSFSTFFMCIIPITLLY